MDPRCGFVFNVYTEPAHRKQGLGRRLMEAMHEWCRGEGIERVVLNASTFGQPIYAAMGYVVAERADDADWSVRFSGLGGLSGYAPLPSWLSAPSWSPVSACRSRRLP